MLVTGRYNNNQLCRWIIYAPKGAAVQLRVLQVDLEHGQDFLKIYDGVVPGQDSMVFQLTGKLDEIQVFGRTGQTRPIQLWPISLWPI